MAGPNRRPAPSSRRRRSHSPRPGGSSPSPTRKGSLEGFARLAVAVAVAPVIGVHKDVGAALQFGIDAARRLELEAAGAGPGYSRAVYLVARQESAHLASIVGADPDPGTLRQR